MVRYENVGAYTDTVWGFATRGDLYVGEEGLIFVPAETRVEISVPAISLQPPV
jgi:hypothetical protein